MSEGTVSPTLNVHLRQLAHLREAARDGVTAAAERLGISQPALSQSLAELERRLGVVLFEAAGRRRRLTDDGREVLAFAERVLGESEALAGRLAERARGEGGLLRVGMIDAASLYMLPGVVPAYRAAYPAVDLVLHVDASTELMRRLRGFELDLVFAVGPPDEDIEGVEVDREPLHIYAPPGVRGRASVDTDWVLYPAGSRTREAIDAGLGRLGIRPRVTLESGNPEVLRQMVLLGLGWSVLPPAVAERGEHPRPRRGEQVGERTLFGMRRRSASPNPRAEAFLELALAEQGRRPGGG